MGWDALSVSQAENAYKYSVVVTVRVESDLIGVARLISDMASIGIIVDVMVRPEYQKMGIGDTLVRMLLDVQKASLEDKEVCYVNVLASKGNEVFYKNIGFMDRPNVMLGAGMTIKLVEGKIAKFERR